MYVGVYPRQRKQLTHYPGAKFALWGDVKFYNRRQFNFLEPIFYRLGNSGRLAVFKHQCLEKWFEFIVRRHCLISNTITDSYFRPDLRVSVIFGNFNPGTQLIQFLAKFFKGVVYFMIGLIQGDFDRIGYIPVKIAKELVYLVIDQLSIDVW